MAAKSRYEVTVCVCVCVCARALKSSLHLRTHLFLPPGREIKVSAESGSDVVCWLTAVAADGAAECKLQLFVSLLLFISAVQSYDLLMHVV
jgi:hypothetical protein